MQSAIYKCTNPRASGWPWYGGRGIKVCSAWRRSFATFLRGMGRKPAGTRFERMAGKMETKRAIKAAVVIAVVAIIWQAGRSLNQIGSSSPSPAAAYNGGTCKTSDIEIRQLDRKGTMIIGELVNHCTIPIGIQIQITFRDASGRVVHTDHFWPASTRNVAPEASVPFMWPIPETAAKEDRMIGDIIEVHRWNQ